MRSRPRNRRSEIIVPSVRRDRLTRNTYTAIIAITNYDDGVFDPVHLRSFVTVAGTLSFTRAAERLELRQSTVSQHYLKLEAAAGRTLFVRDTHSVVLTADGEVIGGSRFEEPDEAGNRILVDHTFLARAYWTPEDYTEVKGLLFDHAFTVFEAVELRVGVDNARTRGAVEEFLGAVHVDIVATPLGDHAVYELSRDTWARRV